MERSSRRIVHDREGLNTGEWPIATADHFITPVEQFFTRSHAPVPVVDAATWRLEIGGLADRPTTFSLKQLGLEFPERTLPATLVCAGLRRGEYLSVGPLPGELPWGVEAVSTGEWSGVALADVLRGVGVSPDARHLELIGLDEVERQGLRFGFGGSIDLDKAMDGEVLLATRLNGVPLPPAHGFPLRALVPGWIGARSVKWLGRINLRATPSDNYFQARAYRLQRKASVHDPRDVSAGDAMSEVPLNAVILDPMPDQTVPAGPVRVRGWAMGSGGRALTGVELSPDDGARWVTARVSRPGLRWTWSFWEATLDLAPGPHVLVARAGDGSGAVQPASVAQTWNVKGYGNNAWHRVRVTASFPP